MEDRQLICDKLLEVLKETRGGSNVASLKYDDQKEIVTIEYDNNYQQRVNVMADSGIAMIRDIIKYIN